MLNIKPPFPGGFFCAIQIHLSIFMQLRQDYYMILFALGLLNAFVPQYFRNSQFFLMAYTNAFVTPSKKIAFPTSAKRHCDPVRIQT